MRTIRAPHAAPLADHVYQALKKDIITGLFKPGESLSENLLARRYHTSRTPVREAAARLERENLLRAVSNKGYFVPHLISLTELNELYEYRAVIESTCAELAAKRDPDSDLLDRLKDLAAVRYEPGNRRSYTRFIEADTAFHVGVARLTRNQLFIRAVSDLRSQIERLLYAAIDVGDYGARLSREHIGIYQAIKSRDTKAARELMLEHVLGSKEKILKLL